MPNVFSSPPKRSYIQYNRALRPDSMKENPEMIVILSPQTYTTCKNGFKIHGILRNSIFLWFFSFLLYFLMEGFLWPSTSPKILAKTVITLLIIKIFIIFKRHTWAKKLHWRISKESKPIHKTNTNLGNFTWLLKSKYGDKQNWPTSWSQWENNEKKNVLF